MNGVVTVSSINSKNQLSTFSNYGEKVNFLAPGGDGQERLDEALLNTTLNNSYDSFSGTSMSAPLVTGSLALLMSYKSDINAFKALRALTETSTSKNLTNYKGQNENEYRLLNVKRALSYVKDYEDIKELNPMDLNPDSTLELNQILANEEGAAINTRLSQTSTGCSSVSSKTSYGSVKKSQGHPLMVTFMFLLPLLTSILKRMF